DRLLPCGRELWNAYGPTETTIYSTIARLTSGPQKVTIGRAVSNTTLYVLDDRLQPVPIGVPGELYIGGAGVSSGYWRRPDQTTARFVPAPFPNCPSDVLYRTGDLVRWLPGAELEYLGRC